MVLFSFGHQREKMGNDPFVLVLWLLESSFRNPEWRCNAKRFSFMMDKLMTLKLL